MVIKRTATAAVTAMMLGGAFGAATSGAVLAEDNAMPRLVSLSHQSGDPECWGPNGWNAVCGPQPPWGPGMMGPEPWEDGHWGPGMMDPGYAHHGPWGPVPS